jgi:CRISPR-associated protein Cas2
MLLISYDISNNKIRSQFSKFLGKYGHRLQFSVFEIKNSDRILSLIQLEIENRFEKQFKESDSVIIFEISTTCNITRYGYASHENDDFIII